MRASSIPITGGHLMLLAALLGLVTAGVAPLVGATSYVVLPIAFLTIFVLAIASVALEAERRPLAIAFGAILFPIVMWPFAILALVAATHPTLALASLGLATVPAALLMALSLKGSLRRRSDPGLQPVIAPAE